MGKRIVELREALGMSQAELARAIGIKQPSMHLIERGITRSLRATTMQGLCRVLNTTPSYLFGEPTSGDNGGEAVDGGVRQMVAELEAILRTLDPQRRIALMQYARYLQDPRSEANKMIPARAVKPRLVANDKPKK